MRTAPPPRADPFRPDSAAASNSSWTEMSAVCETFKGRVRKVVVHCVARDSFVRTRESDVRLRRLLPMALSPRPVRGRQEVGVSRV